MIQIIIVIISIILLLLLKEYLSNNFYISDIISNCVSEYVFQNKKVFINENENRFILFKRNDSVSDMKILNILYQCQYEDDEKEFIL
jgi:hypothetical protein